MGWGKSVVEKVRSSEKVLLYDEWCLRLGGYRRGIKGKKKSMKNGKG